MFPSLSLILTANLNKEKLKWELAVAGEAQTMWLMPLAPGTQSMLNGRERKFAKRDLRAELEINNLSSGVHVSKAYLPKKFLTKGGLNKSNVSR